MTDNRSVRVEIRMDGRVHFLNDCLPAAVEVVDNEVSFRAKLAKPAPVPPRRHEPATLGEFKPERFDEIGQNRPTTSRKKQEFDADPRNSDEVIMQVHSGSRQEAAPRPRRKRT